MTLDFQQIIMGAVTGGVLLAIVNRFKTPRQVRYEEVENARKALESSLETERKLSERILELSKTNIEQMKIISELKQEVEGLRHEMATMKRQMGTVIKNTSKNDNK